MATIYDYLRRRKADLEVRMIEAQRRAQEPFEVELRALDLALGAIERAGLAEGVAGEEASFAPSTSGKRGRRGRSLRDMILLVLDKAGDGLDAAEIVRQLERRWSRAAPTAAVMLALQELEAEQGVRRAGAGWIRARSDGAAREAAARAWDGAGRA